MKKYFFLVICVSLSICFGLSYSFAQKKPLEKPFAVDLTQSDTTDPIILPLLGVISGPDPTYQSSGPNITTQLKEIGVTSIRNQDYYDDRLDMEQIFNCKGSTYPSWSGCDANDDKNYDWEKSDKQFNSIISSGFEILLRLGGEFQCGIKKHSFKGPQNAEMEKNWIIAANKVVARYKNWKGKQPLEYLNIWTEFPGKDFWDRSDDQFIKFWAKAFQSIKKNHPEFKIGGPGFSAFATLKVRQGQGGVAKRFLEYLYKNQIKPDWFGWHIFSNDPSEMHESALAYENLVSGKGPYTSVAWAGTGYFSNMQILVDAYGISNMAKGKSMPKQAVDRIYNRAVGASSLTSQWIVLEHFNIHGAWLYRANDSSKVKNPNLPKGGPGLFWSDGSYKPHAHAVRLWSRMVHEFPQKIKTPVFYENKQKQKLWILAGQSSDAKKIGVLVANPNRNPLAFEPKLAQSSIKNILAYKVNDRFSGKTPESIHKPIIVVPGSTVMLIEIEVPVILSGVKDL